MIFLKSLFSGKRRLAMLSTYDENSRRNGVYSRRIMSRSALSLRVSPDATRRAKARIA
jgi:hypothetical protein